jgi:hypothetical protein
LGDLNKDRSADSAEPSSKPSAWGTRRDTENEGAGVQIAVAILAYKALWWAAVLALLRYGTPHEFDVDTWSRNFRFSASDSIGWRERIATWDAQHYLHLALDGYGANEASAAFYPLWPLVLRWTHAVFPIDIVVLGLVLSNVLSTAGLWLLGDLLCRTYGRKVGILSLLILLAYPGAMFFQLIYSESLFLLLLAGMFRSLARHDHVGVTVCAFLLPISRAVGVFTALPLLGHAISRRRFSLAALATVPMFGHLAYLGLMWSMTGTPWAGYESHGRFVSAGSLSKLIGLGWLNHFVNPGGFEAHGFVNSLLDRTCFVLALASIPAASNLGLAPFLYFVGSLLSGPINSMMSFSRYLTVNFPLFVCWSGLARRNVAVATVTLLPLLGAQAWLTARYLANRWAG